MHPATRALLILSIATNLALGVAWFHHRPSSQKSDATGSPENRPRSAPTRVPAAKAAADENRYSFWSAIHSDDDSEYARRLKAAGLPQFTIHSLIDHRVRSRYAEQMRAFEPEHRFWRPASYAEFSPEAMASGRRLSQEIFEEIKDVLGADGVISAKHRAHLQRTFGNLSSEKLALLEGVERDYGQVLAQMQGGGIMLRADIERRALLETERRADLAAILSPDELVEYDLRSSRSANTVRRRMRNFDATEEEFRQLSALQLDFDRRIGGDFPTPAQEEERRAAEPELMKLIEATLGPERFAEYRIKTDPTYAATMNFVNRFHLPAETTAEIITLRRSLMHRAEEIRGNPNLSPQQRTLELQSLSAQASSSLGGRMAPEAFQTYSRGEGRWIERLARTNP